MQSLKIETELFGIEMELGPKLCKELMESMRRSDQLAKVLEGKEEEDLLVMLAFEINTKKRVFVLERIYIKYKKARERREKVELLTS